jgi:Holliday junction resolvase RusA-like endonuclease
MNFFIPGKPQAKQRPFFNRKTGVAFSRKETVSYENLVKTIAHDAMGGRPLLTGPLTAAISIQLPAPKSKPKWWMDAMRAQEIGATVTPDVDNVAKSITDALNSVLYHDDKQIVLMTVTKTYVEEDVGVHVNIYKSESYKYPHDVKKGDMVENTRTTSKKATWSTKTTRLTTSTLVTASPAASQCAVRIATDQKQFATTAPRSCKKDMEKSNEVS